jgi:hypothetical protein
MRIDQRNAGASVTLAGDPQYGIDRWYGARGGGIPNLTGIRSTTAPVGFTNSFLITIGTGTAPGAGGYAVIGQRVEGFNVADLMWGTANAKPVTLSFWVRCSVTGVFGISFRNGDASTTYCTTYSINVANTWEYKTVIVPGVTTGTWHTDNRGGIEPLWDLGVGTQYSGTAGQVISGGNYFGVTGTTKLSSTTGATFYLAGVQLEEGKVATPFEYRSYQQELALCQRYFIKHNNPLTSSCLYATGAFSAGGHISVPYPVVMRATPTAVTIAYINDDNTASLIVSTLNNSLTTHAIRYAFTVSSGSYPYCSFTAQSSISAEL